RVLLPEPEAPTTATTSPRATSNVTPSRMVSPPEGRATRLPRPSARRAGAPAGEPAGPAAWTEAAGGAGASAIFIPDSLLFDGNGAPDRGAGTTREADMRRSYAGARRPMQWAIGLLALLALLPALAQPSSAEAPTTRTILV